MEEKRLADAAALRAKVQEKVCLVFVRASHLPWLLPPRVPLAHSYLSPRPGLTSPHVPPPLLIVPTQEEKAKKFREEQRLAAKEKIRGKRAGVLAARASTDFTASTESAVSARPGAPRSRPAPTAAAASVRSTRPATAKVAGSARPAAARTAGGIPRPATAKAATARPATATSKVATGVRRSSTASATRPSSARPAAAKAGSTAPRRSAGKLRGLAPHRLRARCPPEARCCVVRPVRPSMLP